MTIPASLLDVVAGYRRAGHATALIVRHAERHPIVDLETHHALLLTDVGHAQAREAGRSLGVLGAPVRVLHSPVQRCAQTARGLVDGARAAGVVAELIGADASFGDPFLLDRPRALRIAATHGPGFLRAWCDGQLPSSLFEPWAQAARGQVTAASRHLAGRDVDDDAITVIVSHDWNIAIVREAFLGFRPEQGWPSFLDGVVVASDDNDVVVAFDGRTARLGRPPLLPLVPDEPPTAVDA
jgi:broad specificity phosphatase PhoE